METPIAEISPPTNFLIGPTKTGKTTLCHFLTESKLAILKKGLNFSIQAYENKSIEKMIGNHGHSKTSESSYFENFCDFPGINDTRGDEKVLSTLLVYYKEIQKTSRFRFILALEENYITTAYSSYFFNFCNEFIDTFGLEANSAHGIHLIITKSTQDFINQLPDILSDHFPDKENFIVEGIKNRTIRISSFDKPVFNDSEYVFSQENRQRVLENIHNTGFLWNHEIKINILPRIYTTIEKIKSFAKATDIGYISELADNPIIKCSSVLIIDKDIDVCGETLEIDSPTVIVKTLHDRRFITLRGVSNPVIRFSSNVKLVINGESLVLTTANAQKHGHYLDPVSKEFKHSYNFLCLESVCINSGWTEHASHNNKFIDLIVYFNQNFGRINVDDQWRIKKITCDIGMKLHVNECMRTKSNIVKTFKSLRRYEDVASFLEATKKTESNQEFVNFLESYIINLPSIFQIFMKPSLFGKISTKDSEIQDLREIRKQLIKKYLKLITDFKSQKADCKLEITDSNLQNYSSFVYFVDRLCNFTGNITYENTGLVNEIDDFMMCAEYDNSVDDFFCFYNALTLTTEKIELYKYQITGDISKYPNFEALLDVYNKGQLLVDDEGVNILASGSAISMSALGIFLGAGVGRIIATRAISQGAVGVSIAGATTIGAAVVGLGFIVIDIGINLICAMAKSGYYKNAIKVEGKDIRLDCRINK